ncbi:hypothetical protein [Rhizobium sp. H4]|uniref:hypothetical protein n=1 Tax=Rhizobium sp. H4 TaxID=2035449 RepID=UPI001FE1C17A|nr:hypothetical protein [Rhizobium sp. H4]
MGEQPRRNRVAFPVPRLAICCESVEQGRQWLSDTVLTVRIGDYARPTFSVVLVERRVIVGIVDERAIILVSIRCLRGCRKLRTIRAPFGRLARLSFFAGCQPPRNQRIHQE